MTTRFNETTLQLEKVKKCHVGGKAKDFMFPAKFGSFDKYRNQIITNSQNCLEAELYEALDAYVSELKAMFDHNLVKEADLSTELYKYLVTKYKSGLHLD